MEYELQLIKKMDQNDKLIRDRYSELKEKYGNRYIAIDSGNVIADAKNLVELEKILKKGSVDILTVLVQYIPKIGIEILY